MKTNQKGFIVPLLITVISLLIIGGGIYIYSQNKPQPATQQQVIDNKIVPTPTDQKEPIINQIENNSATTSGPHIDFVREYDLVETNVIHSDTGTKVTVEGSNFIKCNKPMNCEVAVYIGDKSFDILTPSVSDKALDFIPTKLENGTYDLYLYNKATGVKSNSIKIKIINLNQSVIQLTFPHGGETFKLGQKVTIKWNKNLIVTKFYPNDFPTVNIQVVSDKIEKCPGGYTNDNTMGPCRGYEIYNGPNTGSFDWVIPTNLIGADNYMLRIWPDVGMETAQDISIKGFYLDCYSGFFGISK